MPHAIALDLTDRIEPTPERLRRGDLQRRAVQFPGVTDVSDVFQADRATILDFMHDAGEITSEQHAAGEVYQRLSLLAGRVRARTGATARLTELRGRNGQSDDSARAEMACIRAERALGRRAIYLNTLCLDDHRINPVIARQVLDALADHLGRRGRSAGAGQAEGAPDDKRAYRSASPVHGAPGITGEGRHGR